MCFCVSGCDGVSGINIGGVFCFNIVSIIGASV